MPSPLDRDFFDLLQQLATRIEESEAKESMRRIIDKVLNWRGQPLWRSMEEMFYNLHVSAVLEHKLYRADRPPDLARQLVNDFLRSIRRLLGEAHGARVCERHQFLLEHLNATDAVLTFKLRLCCRGGARRAIRNGVICRHAFRRLVLRPESTLQRRPKRHTHTLQASRQPKLAVERRL
jgi:hypothetical protein